MKNKFSRYFAVGLVIFLSINSVLSQKMSPEEIITKHLASMGSAEDIAKLKSRVFIGTGTLDSRLTANNQQPGVVQFGSQEDRSVFGMVFNFNDYPYDKAAFDGKKITVGKPLGRRTPLAEFLRTQEAILKQGLFGGTLNSYWPLLDVEGRNIKISYDGRGNWADVPVVKAKFLSKTGGLNVTLYFDASNFRHVGSEYKYTIPPRQGGMTSNASQLPSHFTLKETFSNFKTVNGVTFPFSYKLEVDNTGQTVTTGVQQGARQWMIEYTEANFDQDLALDVFKVS